MTHRPIHLSASAVAAFKACPRRFQLSYIEGIRQAVDADSLRVGTNWHALHEVYRIALASEGATRDSAFAAAIEHLNAAYRVVPDFKTTDEWALERTILAASFAGYIWYYTDADPIATLATEISFKLPLRIPGVGMPLPESDVVRLGKIDRLIRWQGHIYITDYKSTSKPINSDSTFWSHLNLDTQISMYVTAAQELADAGELEQYGVPRGTRIHGGHYDVWKKPKLEPSMLTQKDTAAFVESGVYQNTQFTVTRDGKDILVDGLLAERKDGAKEGTFAIRETPDMFGARLLADIYTRPDFYFARREIPRSDAARASFLEQLYSIYQTIKSMRDSGHWFNNEQQCEATFRCAYTSICYTHTDVSQGQTPDGFKRIFTDLTVDREAVEL